MAKRPYSEAFLKLGFTELDGKPKCVVCLKVLSAESMKKNKLKRHLETNHPNCLNKPVEFFERKLNSIQGQRNIMTKFATENKLAVYSSYVVSYQIAKQKKGHTIGEDLLMPVMKEVVKIMIGEKESKKLNAISLSNSSVKRCITDMSDDVLEQILTHVKASPFYSIQLDESTDIAGLPQLSVFIRYINNGAVSEDLLFCKALKLHTKGEDIFQCLNDFFTEHSIPWEKCAGICTDGAAACTGFKSGVVKRIKEKAPDAEWTHCFLHREALCAKKMSQELHEILNSVVKCVNLIKARPLTLERRYFALPRKTAAVNYDRNIFLLKTFFNDKNFLTLRLQTNTQQQCLIEIEGSLNKCDHSNSLSCTFYSTRKASGNSHLHKVCLPEHIMWHRWQDMLYLFLHS